MSDFSRAVMALPSVARASYWWLLYREYLYKCTAHERRLNAKCRAAQEVAADEVDALQEERFPNSGLWLEPNCLAGLRQRPGWSSDGWQDDLRRKQAARRLRYWERVGDARWVRYWELRRTALAYLRASWPVSPANVTRAERWLAARDDEAAQDLLEAESRRERQAIEREQAARAHRREIKREAREMLAEILPGFSARRRMSKAHAFDTIIQLLESANVDARTKEAIGRLRQLVDGDSGAASGLPASPVRPSVPSNRRGYPEDGGEELPGTVG